MQIFFFLKKYYIKIIKTLNELNGIPSVWWHIFLAFFFFFLPVWLIVISKSRVCMKIEWSRGVYGRKFSLSGWKQESLWHLARVVQTGICLRHFYYKILKLNIKHIWWQIETDLIFIKIKRPSWSNKYLSKYSSFPEDIDLDFTWLTLVTQPK